MGNEFDLLKTQVKNQMRKAVEEACIMVEADAKLLCPVKSGTLKRSITHDVEQSGNKVEGTVGTNVEYAYWTEQKKPYLEPAVDQNLEPIKNRIAEVLKDVKVSNTKVDIR